VERTRGPGTDRDRLLRAAREGDGIALARLLELSERDLRSAATRAVGRRGHSDLHGEDVYAESMVTVVREIATLRSNDYQGFPQLVRVNRDVLRLDATDGWPDGAPVLCRVKMINEYPLIPDLEKLELLLARETIQA
jgi:hypothetical protein